MKRARQCTKECCLAEPGDAFEENVSARKQADQDAFDDIVLADDDFGDFVSNLIESVNR